MKYLDEMINLYQLNIELKTLTVIVYILYQHKILNYSDTSHLLKEK